VSSLRYQVVVLESEIGGAMLIDAISFEAAPGTGQFSMFNGYQVCMGPSDLTGLGTVFDDNYSGDVLTVYDHSQTTHYNSNGLFTIPLDTPYWYSGQGNLIIEIKYDDSGSIPDNQSVYVMYCAAEGNRIVWDYSPEAPAGQLYPFLPHMFISGDMSLDTSTFGSIKAIFQ